MLRANMGLWHFVNSPMLAQGSAGFGAGPNKRDFSGFGGGRNLKNSQVYRHLHRLPFSVMA